MHVRRTQRTKILVIASGSKVIDVLSVVLDFIWFNRGFSYYLVPFYLTLYHKFCLPSVTSAG